MKDLWKKILLAVLSGVLCFLAFPPFEFSPLAWGCLVPLFLAVRGTSTRDAFLYGYLTGAVFFACLLYWLPQVTVPGTIVLILILGVYYGLFGIVSGMCFKYSMDLLLLPFVWVVLEYLRSHVFTGFSWGALGYSQYKTINLIQIADFAGAYGVSFVLVAFNAALFALVTRSKRKISYMMVALLFMLAATSYGMYKIDNLNGWGSSKISVVQGNIPQQMKWDQGFAAEIVSRYSSLTRQAAKDAPDMIIWPETSYPYLAGKDTDTIADVGELSAGTGIPILAGAVYHEGGRYYNSAILFQGKKEYTDVYLKLHLVPFGEYVPFEKYVPFMRGQIDKPIGDFEPGNEYTLFPLRSLQFFGRKSGAGIMRQTNFYKFGVLICFEDVFPYLSRGFVRGGANFLVNITNDAWFGGTAAPRQHLQASVFRAVENRVPVVRAANTGVSCFVDAMGRITSSLEKDGKEVLIDGYATDTITIYRGMTYYTVYGDVFVYFCAFMMVLLLVIEGRSIRRGKKE